MASCTNNCKSISARWQKGQYQGFVNSAATVGKAFGPFLGGVLVDAFNMRMMFIGMMILLVFALVLLMILRKTMSKLKNRCIMCKQN